MSTQAQLDEVNAAITAVLKAQSYTFEGTQVTRADLNKLQTLKRQIESGLANGGRGMRMTGISIRHS